MFDLCRVLQAGLVAVLMVTLGINIMFILDTSKKLQQDPQQTGKVDCHLK